MHRKKAFELLQSYQPFDAQEKKSKEQMLAFLERRADCFERSLEEGHFTASAWLLDRSGQKVLLTLHRKLKTWFQLGGHCDGDPDLLAVALKEAEEESGILAIEPLMNSIFDVDVHQIPAVGEVGPHLHYDVRFLLRVTSLEAERMSSESDALGWFGPSLEAFPSQERSLLRMVEKWGRLLDQGFLKQGGALLKPAEVKGCALHR